MEAILKGLEEHLEAQEEAAEESKTLGPERLSIVESPKDKSQEPETVADSPVHEASITPLHPTNNADDEDEEKTLKDYLGTDLLFPGNRYIDPAVGERGRIWVFDLLEEKEISFTEKQWYEENYRYTRLPPERRAELKERRRAFLEAQCKKSQKGQKKTKTQ